jgi:hypothetical protein
LAKSITWTFTAPSLDKAQAAMLATEFWTGLGFEAHSSSYNRLVFRRKGYGTATGWLAGLGVMGGSGVAYELTVLTQFLPSQVKYSLEFEMGFGWSELEEGALEHDTKPWVDGFIAFINQWTSHAP